MIRHKKDNDNPIINYFIYEFYINRNTCPIETYFVTCYPPAKQGLNLEPITFMWLNFTLNFKKGVKVLKAQIGGLTYRF